MLWLWLWQTAIGRAESLVVKGKMFAGVLDYLENRNWDLYRKYMGEMC